MKITVSNLAWSASVEERALNLLVEGGADGVEVALTRIAEWESLTDRRLGEFRARCTSAGLAVSSLQAIFYNRPNASLLGDAAAFANMCDHTRRVASASALLDARVAVFGAPRNRLREGLSIDFARSLAAERLRHLGDVVAEYGVVLALEPIPSYYGADFLLRARDVADLIIECNHAHIRANWDCACIMLGGDDPVVAIREHADLVAHYHAAEPDLGPFDRCICDHNSAAAALREIGYTGWVAVEMRQHGEDGLEAVADALSKVRVAYGE